MNQKKVNISELVLHAKNDNSFFEPLWREVYKLIAWWANRYTSNQGDRLWDKDDLIQTGYLALYDAVQSYDSAKGQFTTHLGYYVRKHFADVIGTRGGKGGKKRPEFQAVSLDEPLMGDDGDAVTRADLLEDAGANFEQGFIESEAVKQDFLKILEEIQKLPDIQKRALMLTEFDRLTYKETGEMLGIDEKSVASEKKRALQTIRKSKAVKRIVLDNKNLYSHVGLDLFLRTRISAVERAILY